MVAQSFPLIIPIQLTYRFLMVLWATKRPPCSQRYLIGHIFCEVVALLAQMELGLQSRFALATVTCTPDVYEGDKWYNYLITTIFGNLDIISLGLILHLHLRNDASIAIDGVYFPKGPFHCSTLDGFSLQELSNGNKTLLNPGWLLVGILTMA